MNAIAFDESQESKVLFFSFQWLLTLYASGPQMVHHGKGGMKSRNGMKFSLGLAQNIEAKFLEAQ